MRAARQSRAKNTATMRDFGVQQRSGKQVTEYGQRLEICEVGHRLYQRGYVVACEGNLSVRLDAERILLTPSGACKGDLTPQDLLVADLSGAVLSGAGRPSSEMQMHLLYYRSRPDVQAICHAHPPTATGFAVAGRALEEAILPEVAIALGKVPLAPYGTPGTWELCAGLEPLVSAHDAILLQNHGVVTCGKNLKIAYYHMETVEQCARVLLAAESLGRPRRLPRVEVQKLIAARSRYGFIDREDRVELHLPSESADGSFTPARQEQESLCVEFLRKKTTCLEAEPGPPPMHRNSSAMDSKLSRTRLKRGIPAL
jgi:L-fuculose-phosphate aldolase